MPQGQITHSAFTTALASVENNLGIPTSGILSDFMSTTPSGDGPDFDAKIRSMIAGRMQVSPNSALAAVTPQAGPNVTYGGAGTGLPPMVQPTTVNPAGRPNPGVVTSAGAPFPLGLSPGEAATPTPVGVVPQGQPNAGAPVLQPLGSSPFVNGGRMFPVPPALRNPNAPAAAAPGVVASLGPAGQAAAATTGTQSAGAFQGIASQGVQARSQAAILDTMLGDAAQFVTGPGQAGINQFKTIVQRIAPGVAPLFGITPDSIAANESFDKFANQLADAQGAGSDARLAVNQGANPSSHLSPAGVDLIIRQLRGNADYLTARAQLAATYPDQTDRAGFETKIGANLDPRVFQYARMTPQQKSTFYQAMPNKAEFQQAYRYAAQNSLIPPPQGTPAAAAPTAAPTPQPPAVPRG